MYSNKQDESMNGIAGMFMFFATMMIGFVIYAMPYIVHGAIWLGKFIGNGAIKLYKKAKA